MDLPPPQLPPPSPSDDAQVHMAWLLPPADPSTPAPLPPTLVAAPLFSPAADVATPYLSDLAPEPARRGRGRALVAVGAVVALAVGVFAATRPSHGTGKVVTVASLAAASAHTSEAKTATVTMDVDMKGVGKVLDGQDLTMHATGGMDFRAGTMALTIAMDGLPGASGDLEMRYGKGVVYLRSPMFDSVAGNKWLKLDLGKTMAAAGVDVTKLTGAGGMQDPRQFLGVLSGVADGDVTTVGTETIDGVATTHYRASIDPTKALDKAGAEAADKIKALLGEQAIGSMPVDAWVDASGRVVQEKMALTLPAAGSMGYTMHFGHFGEPVDVAVPPDADTIDMSALAGAIGKA